MSTPQRIQRRREKGWRMPENTLYVGRPTKWGNPFQVHYLGGGFWTVIDDNGVDYAQRWTRMEQAMLQSVELYAMDIEMELAPYPPLTDLRGLNLACWCSLDAPCHADVLLNLANRAES